jgi:hypothetical protein
LQNHHHMKYNIGEFISYQLEVAPKPI